MNLGEALRQLPINVAFEGVSGAPKVFGLLRSESGEGEPGREKMVESVVQRRSVTLNKSRPLAESWIPNDKRGASGWMTPPSCLLYPFTGKTFEC